MNIEAANLNLRSNNDYKADIKSDSSNTDYSIFLESETEETVDSLKEQFDEVQDKQGFLGKIWNGFKNLTGLGLSSNDVENTIEQYENGEITYEEAQNTIENFETKQDSTVNLFSNVMTGVATAGIAASAIATGGISLGAIAAGAAVGGAAKAGIKTLDRATNNVKGDAVDLKQIAKDGLTGAIDGAISTATAGMVKGAVAGQTVKQAVKEGVIHGAQAGAISGAVTGAGDYTVEAAFEEDVDFNAGSLFKTTVQTAFFGALAGGVMGGITNGIGQKKLNNAAPKEQLQNSAEHLNDAYKKNIKKVKKEYEGYFDDLDTVETVSARAKGEDSVFAKLESKYDSGSLQSTDLAACAEKIGDGYGVRIQLKSLSKEDARDIVSKALEGTGKSYDDFLTAVKSGETLSQEYLTAIDSLKEAQTGEFVETLIQKIKSKDIILADDEFNNYGTEISSYLTNKQLKQIADAYSEATNGAQLKFVNKSQVSPEPEDIVKVDYKDSVSTLTEKQLKKAQKDSGYVSTQANIKSSKTSGTPLADTELQIRGVEVNDFADIEHIPYDIRQGKITSADTKYSDIFTAIKGMSKESYEAYNKYLTETYKYLRLKEMGITIDIPKLSTTLTYGTQDELIKAGLEGSVEAGAELSSDIIKSLTREGLSKFAH